MLVCYEMGDFEGLCVGEGDFEFVVDDEVDDFVL